MEKGTPGFDPSPYRSGWERSGRERAHAISDRLARARAFLPELVDAILRVDPDIKKILLFGSIAKGRVRHLDFDIDIAVDSDRYVRIVAWALRQEWRIDVVDLRSVAGSPLEGIANEGEVLYERRG